MEQVYAQDSRQGLSGYQSIQDYTVIGDPLTVAQAGKYSSIMLKQAGSAQKITFQNETELKQITSNAASGGRLIPPHPEKLERCSRRATDLLCQVNWVWFIFLHRARRWYTRGKHQESV